MKKYLLLGFAIPDIEMKEAWKADKFPTIQTHKFIWNFIKGVNITPKIKLDFISTRPVSDYPYYKKKIIRTKKYKIILNDENEQILEIGFINFGIMKFVSRFFSGLYYTIKNFMLNGKKDGIIVYSVHIPFMAIGVLVAKIFKVELIGLWTDPPAVSNALDSPIKASLRNIEFKISKYLMAKYDKTIVLSKYLANDFLPNKSYCCMEGLINLEEYPFINEKKSIKYKLDNIKIVYTGTLDEKYGIKELMLAVNNLSNVSLDIYGTGSFNNFVTEFCETSNNINYLGFREREEILYIQREADFLINTRPVEEEFVKYTFPSKTLEYMLSGTPVITTKLKGIPKEYYRYLILIEKFSVEEIRKVIEEAILDFKSSLEIGKKAQKFATTKSYQIQGGKVIDFIYEK